ncbi:MAG TPA: sigma-70 family RNA polymerase sigma factor [Fimbriimonadaceae bacterium]|nr:sigma-70 family RNA polymerase sigma factor [Fimbriimonadaceae bacterium]
MELCIGAGRLASREHLDHTSEAVLVDRCRKQDMDAFGKLVDAYQNRVFGFVRRMVPNAEEASDITQDVFVRAFQSFGRFDARSSVRTWLFRIAYKLCIDRARKAERSVSEVGMNLSPESDEQVDVADNRWQPEMIAIDLELQQAVEDGIRTMSEKLRTVLLLHDREDTPYEEIAKIVGVPVGTVKSRLFLARAHLQNVLRNYLQTEVSK